MSFNVPAFQNPSVMKHSFANVPSAEIPRSSFRRSHGHKTTFDAGYLIPVYCDEALPGDTFNLRLSSVARMMTLINPIMDNLYMDFFFFAVPLRLIWDNFQKFMGEQVDPGDPTDYLVPQIEMGGNPIETGDLGDYFGLPVEVDNLNYNCLHHRAYNLIWNEWFRDQNLQDSVAVNRDDGPDDYADYALLRRGKRHDYFTGCLPWPQKGTAVDLPLGSIAPVIGDGTALGLTDGSVLGGLINRSATNSFTAKEGTYGYAVGTGSDAGSAVGTNTAIGVVTDPDKSGMIADLSEATAATINELREAFQLQKMMERDARGGTRYTEIIRSHFRVVSPDARLQRPEYLGGGTKRIMVDPVPSTTDNEDRELGALGAVGYCNQSGIGFTKSFVEHCVIIGLVSVRADLTYQQSLNRMWSRQTKYDFYWPALAHLGEQAVLNKELHAIGDGPSANTDDDVFGYQERWAEYRYHPSLITGMLRSSVEGSLDVWHLSQDFGESCPALNDSFIVEDPPIDRVIAVQSQPHFVFDGYFDVIATRPMPVYSVPGLIDHF